MATTEALIKAKEALSELYDGDEPLETSLGWDAYCALGRIVDTVLPEIIVNRQKEVAEWVSKDQRAYENQNRQTMRDVL